MSSITFESAGLSPELTANLTTLGYHEMTPIQALSLPAILSGKDVIGQGKTGSGKTCLLYTSPSPRDKRQSRMPSSA